MNNSDDERDQQFDLLTAALLGAAVGAAVTLLLRTGVNWDASGQSIDSMNGSGSVR